MSKPELQEIPEDASKKLILTIASNNQKALIKYIEELEKENKELKQKVQSKNKELKWVSENLVYLGEN